jgi:hypothetical protein
MKFKNLTPHNIKLLQNWKIVSLIAEVNSARVSQNNFFLKEKDWIMFKEAIFWWITNLPEKEEWTILVVSALVQIAALSQADTKERDDIFFPWDFERDNNWNILFCKALMRS